MSAVEDIRIKLENRLAVLEHEIESLRDALRALDDERAAARRPAGDAEADAPPVRGTPSQPAASGKSRRRPARRPRASVANGGAGEGGAIDGGATQGGATDPEAPGASSAELERLLAETGGLTAVELARQTGTDYGVVLARIRQLEQAGRSRR